MPYKKKIRPKPTRRNSWPPAHSGQPAPIPKRPVPPPAEPEPKPVAEPEVIPTGDPPKWYQFRKRANLRATPSQREAIPPSDPPQWYQFPKRDRGPAATSQPGGATGEAMGDAEGEKPVDYTDRGHHAELFLWFGVGKGISGSSQRTDLADEFIRMHVSPIGEMKSTTINLLICGAVVLRFKGKLSWKMRESLVDGNGPVMERVLSRERRQLLNYLQSERDAEQEAVEV